MVEVDERRPWNGCGNLMLIGPGAAGKSTLGISLAPLLHYHLVDLDREFEQRRGPIGAFICAEGYERYKTSNSALAEELTTSYEHNILLVASSGFLTSDNPPAALKANTRLLKASYSICLLPSRDFERTVAIVADRQLQRPFARERAREEETIRTRFPVYRALGDLLIFSEAPARDIAQIVASRLSA